LSIAIDHRDLARAKNLEIGSVAGWRPVKPPAMPEASYSIPQLNRKLGLRLGHAWLTFLVVYKARDAIAAPTCD
jgi:hypothetical protein